MSPFIIYGLVDPRTNAVRYIGRSSSGLRRPKHHAIPSVLRKDRTHKGAWLRLLSGLGLKAEIIILEEFSTADDLGIAECFWIAQARGVGWMITNVTTGGDGGLSGMRHSNETRAKIGAAHKGKVISEVQREKQRLAVTGKRHTVEARAKMSAARSGRPLTPEHRAAAAAGQVGRIVTQETREKIAASNRTRWANLSSEQRATWLARRSAATGKFR